jgi:hypothetical protein
MTNTYLRQQITQGPSNQGCHGLGNEGLLVQGFIVGGPSWYGTSTNFVQVPKQGTRCGLGKGQGRGRLLAGRRIDAKGTDREKGRYDDE